MTSADRPRRLGRAGVALWLTAAIMVVAGCASTEPADQRPGNNASLTPDPDHTTAARVVRVVDGDTLIAAVDGGNRVTVRLIGVDTPETKRPHTKVQCFGPESAALTTSLATPRQQIVLESDPVVGDTDRYGRTLAYVYLADYSMLNERLVQAGAAREYDFDDQPYRYRARFRKDETTARTTRVGLWGRC